MKDKIFGVLQRVGRSFMLPIALLPVAGLLLGLGSSFTNATTIETYHLGNIIYEGGLLYTILDIMSKAGSAVFDNLALLFAMGVSIGMAKKEKEVAALSGAIAYLVMNTAISALISAKGVFLKKLPKQILQYAILLLGAFCALVPIVSCVTTAFKNDEEYRTTSVMTLPESWLNFENFKVAWEKADMGKAFLNSFLILVCVLVGSTMISAMLAYVLNRFQFRGNHLIRNLFMVAALIPGIATQVTVYQIMTVLHLVNTLYGYIFLMLGTDVIAIYIFLQFFENLPKTLDEAAILDGCSYFGVFFRILLPLLKPAIVTSAILKGVGTYNEYYMANLYLQDKNLYQVVSTSLYTFTGPMGSQYQYICAGVIITMIPILIIFLFCQKQIYSGMAMGAVKE